MLEGPKIGWSPRIQESRASAWKLRREVTQNPRKHVLASKVVNPFISALVPPFIGRRRDFYILRLPSNLENMPNVNMSMNVFYIPWFVGIISYIYKPATSSHFKPGLFETASLTSSSNLWSFIHEDLSLIETPEPRLPEIRGFVTSWVSPDFSHPETNNRIANQSQVRQLFREMSEG
jgi:hypothetical protein